LRRYVEERAPGASLNIVDFVEPMVILFILILNAIVVRRCRLTVSKVQTPC